MIEVIGFSISDFRFSSERLIDINRGFKLVSTLPWLQILKISDVYFLELGENEGLENSKITPQWPSMPGRGGGVVLPYKGLMGTCGQPGYVFREFCLKQGIKFIIFCLNQGIDLSIFVLNKHDIFTWTINSKIFSSSY